MPKDERLYARFDIGMDEHPKIMLLSDRAFRALIESTMYSRRQRTDGLLAKGVALKKWGAKAAKELCTNDPERPSWVEVDGGFLIHDFDKHQTTNADIDAKREAGRLGGLAKAAKRVAPATESPQQKSGTTLAKTDTDTDTKTETSTTDVVEKPRSRGSRVPSDFTITESMRLWAKENVPLVNIDVKTPEFIDYWKAVPGEKGVKLDWEATWHNGMRKQQEWAKRDTPAGEPAPRRVVSGRASGQ